MNHLDSVLEIIKERNPRHSKKLSEFISRQSKEFFLKAEAFFKQYETYASKRGRSLHYGVESYLKMIEGMVYEQMQFIRTGEYTCKSFADANRNVYSNPEVMEAYMHGLMLSQFLWSHHYDILLYFEDLIDSRSNSISSYLEIGGGHGLYFNEALKRVKQGCSTFDLVDISESSVQMAKEFIDSPQASFHCDDIFTYSTNVTYDFITMGEVLEHVEDPVQLLRRVSELLSDDGVAFITTPSNSPAIDHIYLFHSMKHVEDVIAAAGLTVVDRRYIPSERMSLEEAEKRKITVMFAGLIGKYK